MDIIAPDTIFLVLPDGREVVGRALVVNNEICPEESGTYDIKAEFKVTLPEPNMTLCCVLMVVDKPTRERVHIGQGRLL